MDLDFGEVLRYPQHPGAIILRLPYAFTSKEINERLREFFMTVNEKDLSGTIIIVELSKYRSLHKCSGEFRIRSICSSLVS